MSQGLVVEIYDFLLINMRHNNLAMYAARISTIFIKDIRISRENYSENTIIHNSIFLTIRTEDIRKEVTILKRQ